MTKSAKPIYAFIDSQNLNIGTISMNWKLDWGKFRLFLRNKYKVEMAFLFIGYIKDNSKLYESLKSKGYILIFKKVLAVKKEGRVHYKGNVDAELVLHTMIQYNNFSKAIIASADGDFRCLVEYLVVHNKLAKIITPNSKYSSLLREFNSYISDLTVQKGKLQFREKEAFPR